MFGRRLYVEKKRDKAALAIQSAFRMAKERRNFIRVRAAVIILQCGTRRVLAKRELKKLKTDARSVEGIKARNTGLEKKIMELQQTMDRRVKAAKEEQVRCSHAFCHCERFAVTLPSLSPASDRLAPLHPSPCRFCADCRALAWQSSRRSSTKRLRREVSMCKPLRASLSACRLRMPS
jgi:hypothetical protein